MHFRRPKKNNQSGPQSETNRLGKSAPATQSPVGQLHEMVGNQGVSRLVQAKLRVSNPGDGDEREADRVADAVMRTSDHQTPNALPGGSPQKEKGEEGTIQTASEAGPSPEMAADAQEQVDSLPGGGQPLPASARAFFEPRFGHDFSEVRVHTNSQASQAADSINALAFTRGRDIVFAEGQYSSESSSGQRLLAHELVHVAQQRGNVNRAVIQRKITDAELETEFQTWAADKKEKVNKNSVDYAHQLWTFIFEMVGDAQTGSAKAKPQKPAELKKWQEGFEKAQLVADWLIKIKKTTTNDSLKNATVSRLSGMLELMQQADFLPAAMSRAGDLDPENRKSLFETILKSPQSATVSDIERIVSFFCASAKDAADCTIIQTLTDGNDHPIKSSLDVAKSKGMVKVLVHNYGTADKLVDALAELFMFNPKIRNDISEALMKSELGGSPDLLFKVLKHKLFVEPEYGASLLATLQGPLSKDDYEKKRMKDDMPWAYTFKQKYYVDFLIDLAKKQTIVIPRPAKMAFAELKTWLDANTDNIAKAAQATYTKQEEVFEVYRNIADIFFYHVPHDRSVTPDLAGKIGHLKAGLPSKMRFEADCDVFATYAMRLLSAAGFEAIGYLGIYPKGAFKARAPHVVALIRKANKYSFINNKDIFDLGITETKPDEKKKEAIVKLKERGLAEGYESPLPTDADIFYGDAEANGKMSSKFFGSDASLQRTDLQ